MATVASPAIDDNPTVGNEGDYTATGSVVSSNRNQFCGVIE